MYRFDESARDWFPKFPGCSVVCMGNLSKNVLKAIEKAAFLIRLIQAMPLERLFSNVMYAIGKAVFSTIVVFIEQQTLNYALFLLYEDYFL